MDALTDAYPGAMHFAHAIRDNAYQLFGEHANVDFALVIMADILRLPAGAPIALFALGRTVGWIGHALEQYATDQLIRPRARYTGLSPI
jgi:citrate synthase